MRRGYLLPVMGVFYRKDKLELLESGNFWLSETPEKPGSMSWGVNLPRLVTWGQFERVADSFRFCFYDTHFPHRAQVSVALEQLSARLRFDVVGCPE